MCYEINEKFRNEICGSLSVDSMVEMLKLVTKRGETYVVQVF